MKILTFDIEEWFHILDNASTKTAAEWSNYPERIHRNMDRILDLLDRHDQKATFFCLGWIAEKYPDIIKEIDSRGHELATHSYYHQLAYEQTPAEFDEDLKNSIQRIEDVSGKKITAYRAPGFSLKEENAWVFEKLIDAGIKIDCSIFPASRSHGGFASFGEEKPTIVNINGKSIVEFPINTTKILGQHVIFSGGGYYRLFPYFMLKRFIDKSDYVMTYFHPRDFDPGQPMIKELGALRKFKSYYGLARAEKKLEKLLDTYHWMSLEDAWGNIDIEGLDNVVIR